MATSLMDPINRFLRRIEEDRYFFMYFSLTDSEALALARKRARNYLDDAIDRMTMDGKPTIDLSDIDEAAFTFNVTLSRSEIFILSSLMYEYYLAKDISRLKTLSVNYTGTELRVFDPSNARTTFQNLYENVQKENRVLLDTYRNTDRNTGSFVSVNDISIDEEG